MRFKEIIETPYLDKVIKQVGQTIKTGSPMPANKLPKGPVNLPYQLDLKPIKSLPNPNSEL